jgi:hypothetical protein
MKYFITTINELNEFITPSLVIDDLFESFPFPKHEEKFRKCMRLYRTETFGEDYERIPITFEEFNPKYDKFQGLNYLRLNVIINIVEFKKDLTHYFITCEDSYLREINEQIQNPSEVKLKIYLHNILKDIKGSYESLQSTEVYENVILNLIKDGFLDSYKRLFDKAKNEVPIYNDIFNAYLLDKPNLNKLIPNIPIKEIVVNPFPRIFKDHDSFLFFEELKNKLCMNDKSLLADFSFVFRKMQKDGNIFDDVTEKSFRNFLNNNYEINLEKLKTFEYCQTDKKIQLYNSLKK